MSNRTLRDLKAGDEVFVVHIAGRRYNWAVSGKEIQKLTRVGRKYAYFGSGHQEKKFHLDEGWSAHDGDHNARANGYGFDVYLSEKEYIRKSHELKELVRLQERLHGSYDFPKLSPDTVSRIHAILDEEPSTP